MDEWLRSYAGACWHCCMAGQHDGTPCSPCNRLAKPNSLVKTNSLSCRCKVFSVSAKWMQALFCCLLNTCRLLDHVHKFRSNASCQCTLRDMEPHPGRALEQHISSPDSNRLLWLQGPALLGSWVHMLG